MNVELRDEARDDLVNGAAFYGEQSVGLDDYFLKCLRKDFMTLETTGGFTSGTVDFTDHYQIVSPMQSTTWFQKKSLMSSRF